MKRKFTRREVLKAAQVTALGAGVAGLGLFGGQLEPTQQTHGVCRICTMHCGLKGTVRGAQLLRVEGDLAGRTHGFICHHGWALREIVHSPERVRRPLLRVDGRLVEVSWDTALGEIASRLNEIKRESGPESMALQAGWPFVRHPLLAFMRRFCHAFGSPNFATVASFCASSGHMARMLVTGSFLHPDLQHTRTLLVWGANPPIADPPMAHLIRQAGMGERKLIVVDPTRTEVAEAATMHLRPRPGTDGALALGMIHVVVRDGLFDRAFVDAETVGFDALAELVRSYSPAAVEQLTGVPATQLETAARLLATHGPSAVWDSLGLQHHANGLQAVRAATALIALLGYVDVPGGMRMTRHAGADFWKRPLPTFYEMTTPEPVPPPVRARPLGADAYPVFELFNHEAQGVLFPQAILEEKPYPLRALFCFGSNPLVTHPDSARWRQAVRKLSLLVSIDPFLNETGAEAHVVLPASTFAEAETASAGDQDAHVDATPMVTPQHESRPDWKILRELAWALGLGAYFPWSTLAEAQQAARKPYSSETEIWPESKSASEQPPRYATRSGKLELSSSLLAHYGLDPLPTWSPPARGPDEAFPLHLITGPRTRAFINSQFRQIPSIRDKMPEPRCEVHPEAAAKVGLSHGDLVAIVSPHGRIVMRASVTDRVHPQVVVVPNGWAKASANELTAADGLDPISGFPTLRSLTCRLEPIGRS
jgi:anaerobic selenocysteine-containing dehydrogenase